MRSGTKDRGQVIEKYTQDLQDVNHIRDIVELKVDLLEVQIGRRVQDLDSQIRELLKGQTLIEALLDKSARMAEFGATWGIDIDSSKLEGVQDPHPHPLSALQKYIDDHYAQRVAALAFFRNPSAILVQIIT